MLTVYDLPDSLEAQLQYAEIEFAGLPQILDDYRQGLIAHAIANWPMLREPYLSGFFQLETDGTPMAALVADAVDAAMEIITENLSNDARTALRLLRDHGQ